MKTTVEKTNVLWDGNIQGSKPSGGISRYSEGLLEKLGSRENLRLLAVCPKGAPAFRVKAPNLRQISTHNIKGVDQFRLKRFQADIFHSLHYQTAPTPVPVTVQTVLDFVDKRYPIFYANREGFFERQKRLLQEAEGVVAISECTKKDALEFTGVAEEKIMVAYPGISPVFRKALPNPSETTQFREALTGGAPFLIWVGPRNGYKNFSTFFHAYAAVAQKYDLHLLLVGGEHLRLNSIDISLAISKGICDRVHPVKGMNDYTLRCAYAASAALVQSSLWEGFGIPLVEALSCGTHLLLADIPVFREVAGEHALFAPPTNPDAWIAAIEGLLQKSQHPAHEIKAAVEKRFDSEITATHVATFYQQLLAEKKN